MELEVQSISPGETACNVSLQAVERPEGEYAPSVTCNSRFVAKKEGR